SGGVPAPLGVQECVVGREVPRRMDGARDAVATGTDEEGGADDSRASALDPQLVPGTRRGFRGGSGGAQQQGETGDEKVVRISDSRGGETGSPTQPGRSSRTQTHPQILLRRHIARLLVYIPLQVGIRLESAT